MRAKEVDNFDTDLANIPPDFSTGKPQNGYTCGLNRPVPRAISFSLLFGPLMEIMTITLNEDRLLTVRIEAKVNTKSIPLILRDNLNIQGIGGRFVSNIKFKLGQSPNDQ
jgi:hypothetical protein